MQRLFVLLYGLISYLLGVLALAYLLAFLLNLPVPKTIDGGASTSTGIAVVVNLTLVLLFGLQHSVMARSAFKAGFARLFPPAMERSTYLVATAIVVFVLCIAWMPLPTIVWRVEQPLLAQALIGINLLGWLLVVYASFLIDHFELFGLRQSWFHFRGCEYSPAPFKARSLYQYIRHPIMTGVLLGIWITPEMSVGHLLFSLAMTAYILIGVHHEERDLRASFGDRYDDCARSTGRFFPRLGARRKDD